MLYHKKYDKNWEDIYELIDTHTIYYTINN